MKYLLYVIVTFFVGARLYAQVEATMPTMTSVAQSTFYNPAFKPRFNFSFALPANLFLQGTSNSLSWNKTGHPENGGWTLDLNKIASHLKERNYVTMHAQIDPFLLSIRAGARLHLSFNFSVKSYSRLMLPKGLIALTTKGNGPYIGQTLSLSPKGEHLTYFDIGVGGAYTVTHKLTLGGRIKMLRGLVNATTENSKAEITTTADEIRLTAAGDVRSSGFELFKDFKSKSAGEIVEAIWSNSGKNSGVGFDIGATYQVTDRLLVGASIIDLGYINWTNNTKIHTLKPVEISFKGLDLQKVVDAQKKYLDSLKDSFKDKFSADTKDSDPYSTALPTKIYLSAAYSLGHNTSVNGFLIFEKYRERFFPTLSASIHKEFGKRFGASLSYTVTNNSYNNIGAGLSTNLANIQLYVVADNLAYVLTNLKDLQYFNVRLGLNIVARWYRAEEKNAQPSSGE